MAARGDVPTNILDAVREVCAALPETYEEVAWVGTRWRVRTKTFAHVLTIDAGWPPAYARAAATDGPVTLLMFRSAGEELGVLRNAGHPFFAPVWRDDEVGLIIDAGVDWTEVAELVTESYCALAPKALAREVSLPEARTRAAARIQPGQVTAFASAPTSSDGNGRAASSCDASRSSVASSP
jgi:hypothetical protein